MPINFENAAISDAKLGIEDISKAYLGHQQIYPNGSIISALAFTESSVAYNVGATNFVVTGTEDAQYTLSGSTGATPPSGIQTIPSGGSNTHSVSISTQGTGTSSRYPRVDVTPVSSTTPTAFSPPTLQSYDTVLQGGGPAPSYNHTLTHSISGGSPAQGAQGNPYSAGTFTSRTYPLTAGASWFNYFLYVIPGYGKKFTSTSDVTLGSYPSWVTVTNPYFYSYASQPINSSSSNYYSYVRYTVSWTGQSSTQSGTLNITAGGSTATYAVGGNWCGLNSTTNTSGYVSGSGWGPGTINSGASGSTSNTMTFAGSGSITSIGSPTIRQAAYGGDIYTGYSISPVPSASSPILPGDSFTITVNYSNPAHTADRVKTQSLAGVYFTAYGT
jgi:hypothetical protein